MRGIYRARKHAHPDHRGCVPLDSIETNNEAEFWTFCDGAIRRGFIIEWATAPTVRTSIELMTERDKERGKDGSENFYAHTW